MSENETPSQNNGCSEQPIDYLTKAAEACASGDATLGMHLYLAAYEKAAANPRTSTSIAVVALREAWRLACELRERSLAEHIFEKLEPYMTGDEIAECAQALQDMALERLEQYGFSREELKDMAEVISQDLGGVDASVVKVEHISLPGLPSLEFEVQDVKIERVEEPADDASADGEVPAEELPAEASLAEVPAEEPTAGDPTQQDENKLLGAASVFNPYDMYPTSSEGSSWRAATNIGSGWSESVGLDGTTVLDSRFDGFFPEKKQPAEAPSEAAPAGATSADLAAQDQGVPGSAPASVSESAPVSAPEPAPAVAPEPEPVPAPATAAELASKPALAPEFAPAQAPAPEPAPEPSGQAITQQGNANVPSMPQIPNLTNHVFNYQSLVGYDDAVAMMRDFGVGLHNDEDFKSFVQMMNEQHGLDRRPAADTILFRAPAIEDATRFVEATIGELDLPVLRMSMEEGFQGMPVLCVTTDNNNRPRMNRQHNRFEGPAILVLDDLDLWSVPEVPQAPEAGMPAFVMANMTRGAREAIDLIRASVENPDVVVLATASTTGEVMPFYYEVLEPLSIIDIANPSERERSAIWEEIMTNHPSMRGLDLDDLVRFSAGMARFDIYMAAREAVEETYKAGLVKRMFMPVTNAVIFDKIAACHPLDSDEYRQIEERVVGDFVARDGSGRCAVLIQRS